MTNYLLIGHPLGHSMSPFIHKKLFENQGISEDYILKDIAPQNLENSFDFLSSLKGFNITIPHKVNIIPFCDRLDSTAQRYNSVNCVSIKNGEKVGYNTDCDGFLRSCEGEYPMDGKVLLLGIGGAGKMIAAEMLRHGADLTVAVRQKSEEKSRLVIKEIEEKYNKNIRLCFIDNIKEKYDMLINATPVGMYPKNDDMPVSEEVVKRCDTFFDCIYNPTDTKLIKLAKSEGKLAKGGAFMLVLQAVKAHEIWYGAEFKKETVLKIVKELQEEVDKK